jgi:hypothetical protein
MLVTIGPPEEAIHRAAIIPDVVNLPLLEIYLFWIEKALVVQLMMLESSHLIVDGRMIHPTDTMPVELHDTLNGLVVIFDQLENEAMVKFHNVLFAIFGSSDIMMQNYLEADDWFQFDFSLNEFGLLFDHWFDQFQHEKKDSTIKLLKEVACVWHQEYHKLLMNIIQQNDEIIVELPQPQILDYFMK